MKWTGERYKCRNCGEVYPYSLSKCSCGGICDKISDAPLSSSNNSDHIRIESEELQFPDLSQYPELEQEHIFIQHIADALNQSPKRKTSLGFVIYFLFGKIMSLTGLLNLLFFGGAVFSFFLPNLLGFKNNIDFDTVDILCFLGSFAFGLGGLYFFYPYCKLVYLIRNGYFTIGYYTQGGFVYHDRSGNEHSVFSYFMQHFMGDSFKPQLVVISNNNPNRILILNVHNFAQTENLISFDIVDEITDPFTHKIQYDLKRKSFINNSPKWWSWIFLLVAILWVMYLIDYTFSS